MADDFRPDNTSHGLIRQNKDLGNGAFAEVVALEPGSIGGGGGTASSVTVTDGTTSTQKLAVDATGKIGVNNFPASQAVTGTFWQAIQPIGGDIASGATDSGNPVKIGGVVSTTQPASGTTGQRKDLWVGSSGQVVIATGVQAQASDGLAVSPSLITDAAGVGRTLGSAGFLFNGTNWDRPRGDATSGAWVNVKNASLAVTGTFWQATQPVSIAATVTVDTELPAAAALADATANPTIPSIGSNSMLFNGTSWDRARSGASLADGTNTAAAVPAAENFLFNNSTWDRQRNNFNVTTGDTGAKTANFVGATQVNYNASGAIITLLVGAVSGTFTTFQTGLQWSPDGGTTWIPLTALGANITAPASGNSITWNIYPGIGTITPAASGGTAVGTQYNYANMILPRVWRFAITLAGTSPSLTITSINVSYVV